jgi:hypothetical protein
MHAAEHEMRTYVTCLAIACLSPALPGCGRGVDRSLEEYEAVLSTEQIQGHFGLKTGLRKDVSPCGNKKQKGIRIQWFLDGKPAIQLKFIQGSSEGMRVLQIYARQRDSKTRLLPGLGAHAHAFIEPPGRRIARCLRGGWRAELRVSETWLRNHVPAEAISLDRVIELVAKVHSRMCPS